MSNVRKLSTDVIKSNSKKKINLEYYRVSKWVDSILNKIPCHQGWRMYYKWRNLRLWCISTYQKMRYGGSDAECWSLDHTIVRFILPRLKHFRKMYKNCVPTSKVNNKFERIPADFTIKEWNAEIDEYIWAFEDFLDDGSKDWDKICDKYDKKYKKTDDFLERLNRKKLPEHEAAITKHFNDRQKIVERRNQVLQKFAVRLGEFWD